MPSNIRNIELKILFAVAALALVAAPARAQSLPEMRPKMIRKILGRNLISYLIFFLIFPSLCFAQNHGATHFGSVVLDAPLVVTSGGTGNATGDVSGLNLAGTPLSTLLGSGGFGNSYAAWVATLPIYSGHGPAPVPTGEYYSNGGLPLKAP